MSLAGIQDAPSRVIFQAEDVAELRRNLTKFEELEYLPILKVYILHGIENDRMRERFEALRRIPGVSRAHIDSNGTFCSFVPSEATADPSKFWWLDAGHMSAFSNLNIGAFGWDIRRSATPTAKVGVIDTGIWGTDNTTVIPHADLPNRLLGVLSTTNPVTAEVAGTTTSTLVAHDDFNGHGTAVAGSVAAVGDNGLDCIGASWWGTPVVPIKYFDGVTASESSMLRGLEWGISQGIKIFTFQSNFVQGDVPHLFEIVNSALELANGMIFWALPNSEFVQGNYPPDFPYIIWASSTDKDGLPVWNFFNPRVELDCRASVGKSSADLQDSTRILTIPQGHKNETGNSFASPFMAGMAASLWDMLPASLQDIERRAYVIRIIQQTCTPVYLANGNLETAGWGQVNILNAYGRPPSSATVNTGSGSVSVTDLWRDEGTVSTVGSDDGIPGTVRVKLTSVHPCSFNQTTVNELHLRMRLSGPAGIATVRLKNDSGVFDSVGSVSVSGSATTNEIYLTSGIQVTNVQDYIDVNGNITMRVEVPGPIGNHYDVLFDQLVIRSLRESETQ